MSEQRQPPEIAQTCVHCGDLVIDAGYWVHAHRAPDGSVHTGKSRCQSPDVAYGHLAHPADVPCRTDGPNPCLGALNTTGPDLPLPVLCGGCGRALANVGEWCCGESASPRWLRKPVVCGLVLVGVLVACWAAVFIYVVVL